MIVTFDVNFSGPAFAFIIYENLKSKYSQEGFLIGDFSERETKTITDNDQQQLNVFRMIRIRCAVPCPHPFYFYDGAGRINPDKIKALLGDFTPNVVAWYKYKPLSGMNFTFREKIIHRQLASMFHLPPEFFSCCLLISESSDNGSTRSFIQTFMRCQDSSFEQLPLVIVNLCGNTNLMYKSPEKTTETFSKLMRLEIDEDHQYGMGLITKIQDLLDKHTKLLVAKLSKMEETLFELEDEVRGLWERARDEKRGSEGRGGVVVVDAVVQTSPSRARGRGKASSPNKPRGRGKASSPNKPLGCGKASSLNKSRKSPSLSPGGRQILTRSKKKVSS